MNLLFPLTKVCRIKRQSSNDWWSVMVPAWSYKSEIPIHRGRYATHIKWICNSVFLCLLHLPKPRVYDHSRGAEWIVNPLASEDEGKYNVEYRPFLMSPQLMPDPLSFSLSNLNNVRSFSITGLIYTRIYYFVYTHLCKLYHSLCVWCLFYSLTSTQCNPQ